jgi:hypothetical protein
MCDKLGRNAGAADLSVEGSHAAEIVLPQVVKELDAFGLTHLFSQRVTKSALRTVAKLERIRVALERVGIVFVQEDATGGPGVRHPRTWPRS